MTCPKREMSGVWNCGRKDGHPGAHLSLSAERQISALLVGVNALIDAGAKGHALRALQIARKRYRKILFGSPMDATKTLSQQNATLVSWAKTSR